MKDYCCLLCDYEFSQEEEPPKVTTPNSREAFQCPKCFVYDAGEIDRLSDFTGDVVKLHAQHYKWFPDLLVRMIPAGSKQLMEIHCGGDLGELLGLTRRDAPDLTRAFPTPEG